MDENISRAAGASHGTMMDEDGFRSWVEPLGRTLVQRTTLYGRVAEVATVAAPAPPLA
jgi:FO synthase